MTAAMLEWVTGTVDWIGMRLKLVLCRYARNRQGVIGIVFALALVPIIAAGGAAVDLSRAYVVKQRLSAALDAAGLAVAGAPSNLTDDQLQTLMKDYFKANYPTDEIGVPATPSLKIEDGNYTLTATADVDTVLMRIVNIDNITVAESSTIVKEQKGLEVVLVLDNTGSMRGRKIRNLKKAATTFVNTVFGDKVESDLLKVGIVPFTGAVNVGTAKLFKEAFIDTSDPNDDEFKVPLNVNRRGVGQWRGCVVARKFPFDTTDADQRPPELGGGKWGRYLFPDSRFSRYSQLTPFNFSTRGPNAFCPIKLLPLTNKKQPLLSKINQMRASGVTHINVGAVWGWRVLSPTAPYTNGVAYDDENFQKAIIIMTDGANFMNTSPAVYSAYGHLFQNTARNKQNKNGDPPYASLGTTNGRAANKVLDDRLKKVCTKMKDLNILVYTITFDLRRQDIKNTMKDCASEGRAFDANKQDLTEKFEAIANELNSLRIGK